MLLFPQGLETQRHSEKRQVGLTLKQKLFRKQLRPSQRPSSETASVYQRLLFIPTFPVSYVYYI